MMQKTATSRKRLAKTGELMFQIVIIRGNSIPYRNQSNDFRLLSLKIMQFKLNLLSYCCLQ